MPGQTAQCTVQTHGRQSVRSWLWMWAMWAVCGAQSARRAGVLSVHRPSPPVQPRSDVASDPVDWGGGGGRGDGWPGHYCTCVLRPTPDGPTHHRALAVTYPVTNSPILSLLDLSLCSSSCGAWKRVTALMTGTRQQPKSHCKVVYVQEQQPTSIPGHTCCAGNIAWSCVRCWNVAWSHISQTIYSADHARHPKHQEQRPGSIQCGRPDYRHFTAESVRSSTDGEVGSGSVESNHSSVTVKCCSEFPSWSQTKSFFFTLWQTNEDSSGHPQRTDSENSVFMS